VSVPKRFDVVRDVLDHEIVDAGEMPCGMVDDVELEIDARGGVSVVALLVGPGARQDRMPRWAAWLARRAFGNRRVRVAWDEVAMLGSRVRLAHSASSLGLGTVDRRWGRWLSKVPGA
jgi:hypothetical protein